MKFYRICFLLLIALCLGKQTFAQSSAISDDPAQFMQQVRKLMDGSRNPQYIRTAAQTDTLWTSNISASQQSKIIKIVKTQVSKGQKGGNILFLVLRNINLLAKDNSQDFDGFLNMTIQAGEKYDSKAFQKVLENVRTFSESKNRLYKSNYNTLYLLSGSSKFSYDTTNAKTAIAINEAANDNWDTPVDTNFVIAPTTQAVPMLAGALLDLKDAVFAMVTANDSTTFGPTNGQISLKDGIFSGKGGKFSWDIIGDPTTYADLDTYTFQIANPKILAENVTLNSEKQLQAPIKGTFEYRGVKKIKGQPAAYPRFISNGIDAKLKNDRKSMAYKGGFSLVGNQMYSSSLSNLPSTLSVTFNEKPAFKATSNRFILKDSVVTATLATFSMPIATDSLFHPGVTFSYNDDEGLVKLGRAEKTDYAALPYQDSFHKMFIWSQALRWNFAKEKVEFHRIDGKQVVPVRLESFDYFKKERMREISEEFGSQPLLMAASFTQTEKKTAFLAEELAAKFKQNPKTLRRTLERLTLEGYFIYNKPTDQFAVSKKGVLYVLANLDKTDFDNFQITSQYTSNDEIANATIFLPDTTLTILGVSKFIVSDSLKIYGVPSNKKVVMGRNRNFTMSGQLVASNYQFRGHDLKFDYNKFFVNVSPNDSITFTPKEKYTKGQTSEVGAHVKYDKGGTFYLSDPQNKSGIQKTKKATPRLVVPDGMLVYFDQPERGELIYPQEVFFKIPKIDMDGLDQRDVIFEGTFTANGIVPPFQTILKSMPDNSLGFEQKLPATDMKIYGGKAIAKFTDTLTMDNGGLRSKGILKHLSATLTANHISLMSDSLKATGEMANIKEATIGKGYFPAVELKDYSMRWYPEADSMFLLTAGKSFSLYKGTTSLEGGLLLRSSGLYGNGFLKRTDSELNSPDIKFNKDGFIANKSTFAVKSDDKKATKNILTGRNTNIDFNFKTSVATFNIDGSGFELPDSSGMEVPSILYKTDIASAKWDMLKKNILIKGSGETSTYVATQPEQEGLSFEAADALYNLENSTMSIRGVPYIQTVDVKIIPNKGLIDIGNTGQMNALKNARIEIETKNTSHHMRDADVQIFSKNRFEGSATYQYITARKDTFNIKMQNFELKELPEVTKKSRSASKADTLAKFYTTAHADIKEAENIFLAPRMQFKGNINLISYDPSLQLDGFIKPVIKFRKNFQSSWIVCKDAPGETFNIKIDQNLKNEHEIPLSVGLHYNDARGIYMSFLSPKESDGDEDIYLAKGAMIYDEDAKAFKVTPPPGADGLIDESNTLKLDDNSGLASFIGPMKFVQADWLKGSAIVEAQVDSSRFSFNSLLAFKMSPLEPFLSSIATKIVEINQQEQNNTGAEEDFEDFNLKLSALIGTTATNAFAKTTAAGYKPLYEASPILDAPIVLSNVKLNWSPVHKAYFSQGSIGVSNFGKNNINAQMEGVLEIRKADEGDEFSLYIEASPDHWYFFDYRQNELGIVTSNLDFNDQLMAKNKNSKKDMSLIILETQEKETFVNRFDDFYQPAAKKLKQAKTQKKKVVTPAAEKKKKVEQTEGF